MGDISVVRNAEWDALLARIDSLTDERDRARRVAVALEQECAALRAVVELSREAAVLSREMGLALDGGPKDLVAELRFKRERNFDAVLAALAALDAGDRS